MKINEKQLLILFEIAKASCQIHGVFGGYSNSTRFQLCNEILNQQSETVVDVIKGVETIENK